MLNSYIQAGLLVLASIGVLSGCGPSAAQGRAGGPLRAVPPELHGARLLYQRADGIHLRLLGQEQSVRLVEDATCPRWAPDGRSFAFVRGNRIMHYDLQNRSEHLVAEAGRARAVVFHPDGQRILFTDGKAVQSAVLRGAAPGPIAAGPEFFELDISAQGDFLAATVKAGGYRVRRFDLPSGKPTEIGRGCSASISPDGRLVTVNLEGHERLALRDSQTGAERGVLRAPAGLRFDNQKWSNHPDWIAAMSEGKRRDIWVQRVRDGQAWQITDEGDTDRPDLLVDP